MKKRLCALYLSTVLTAGQLQPCSITHGQYPQQVSTPVGAAAFHMRGIACPAAVALWHCLSRQQYAVLEPLELQKSCQQPVPRELQKQSCMVHLQCLVGAALLLAG